MTTASGGNGGVGGASVGGAGGAGGGVQNTKAFVYVGQNNGEIAIYLLDRNTGALAPIGTAEAGANPSFLATDSEHKFLYAVDEQNGGGQVQSFAIDPATGLLTFLNSKSSEGNGPAYVSVHASGEWVFVANYGGNTIAVLPTMADGSLGDASDSMGTRARPHLIRQGVGATAGKVYVPCKDGDAVELYDFDTNLGTLTAVPNVDITTEDGAGPRHLDFHPTAANAWIINELDDTIVTYDIGANGGLTAKGTVSTLPGGQSSGSNTCADIHVSRDGKFVYGSNRGDDSIAIFSVGADGTLTAAGHASTDGETPRNFGLDPQSDIVLVANQGSNEIVTFRRDGASGELVKLLTTATDAAPAWVGVIDQRE